MDYTEDLSIINFDLLKIPKKANLGLSLKNLQTTSLFSLYVLIVTLRRIDNFKTKFAFSRIKVLKAVTTAQSVHPDKVVSVPSKQGGAIGRPSKRNAKNRKSFLAIFGHITVIFREV